MCVSVPYSYIMDIICVCECGGAAPCLAFLYSCMGGCIWVYMCMHHGVGGVHVRMYICVYECLQFCFLFLLWQLLSSCEAMALSHSLSD